MKRQTTFNRSFIIEVPSLPSDFAEQVLDLECELDERWTAETVHKLMELYTQAIEFYCTMASPKFKLFQERLQTLLLKQDERNQGTKEVLEAEVARHSNLHQENGSRLPKTPRKSVQPQPFEVSEQATVEKILFAAESESASSGQSIKECLDTQKTALDERLQARKKGRSSILPVFSECDRGGGSAIPGPSKPDLVSQSQSAEKSRRISLLKAKYENQLAELKQMPPSDTINQVIEKLKEKVQTELAAIEAQYEAKRVR